MVNGSIYYDIKLELSRPSQVAPVFVKQYDSARFIRAQVFDRGSRIILPDGCKALFNIQRSDGTPVIADCQIQSDNGGTYILAPIIGQAVAVSGRAFCDMSILHNGLQVSSVKFIMIVESAAVTNEDLSSNEDFNILQNTLTECRETIKEFKGASESLKMMNNRMSEIELLHSRDIKDIEALIKKLNPLADIDCFKSCLHWLSMGYGSKAVCKTDSRISFFEGDGFYISQRDESLIGQSCNIFIVAEEGYEKFRGKVTGVEETLTEGKGYKILFTNEINNGIKYLSDNGLKPDGFINSLIVSGGVYGDTDVEIPDEFFSGAIGTNCLSGVGGLSSGVGCEALGYKSLALLYYCVATAERAVSIGYRCSATGDESFARNCRTEANGYASDSSGLNTKANGPQSTAGGYATIAEGENQVTYGKFNIIDYLNKFIFILGNGKDGGNRENAFTVDWDGNVECSGGIRCKGDIEIDGKGLLTTDKLGTFALTNYVAGVSGGLKVNLDCPVEADSWKVYINGKEITDENVGINDAFITAPTLVEGEMVIAFFRDGEEILRCLSELTYKNNFIRCGILKGEI